MGAIVGIDALILVSDDAGVTWTELPERNEFSISIKVDVAEHKVFVKSLADAWADKKRTWMSWSGSLSGYMDDTDDTIFEKVVAGAQVTLRFYDSREGKEQAAILIDPTLKVLGRKRYSDFCRSWHEAG